MNNFTGRRHIEGSNGIEFILIAYSVCVLVVRFFVVLNGGGWEDRESFFNQGQLAPGFWDFIHNEIVIHAMFIYMIASRLRLAFVLVFLASAALYYSRMPIALLFLALIFSGRLGLKHFATSFILFFILSVGLLWIRVGDELFSEEIFTLFFISYPLVGIGRLLVAEQMDSINYIHLVGLLFKPVELFLFVLDYLFNLSGELSVSRLAGAKLNQFVYLPLLGSEFNAFGTIAYPFVLALGMYGYVVFPMFLIVQYGMLRNFMNCPAAVNRLVFALLLSGLLLSWISPFIWVLPILMFWTNRVHSDVEAC